MPTDLGKTLDAYVQTIVGNHLPGIADQWAEVRRALILRGAVSWATGYIHRGCAYWVSQRGTTSCMEFRPVAWDAPSECPPIPLIERLYARSEN